MQKIRKEVIRLTDIHCDKKACLNNAKGWCKAKGIYIDGVCRSYAPADTLIKTKTARVEKRSGKYKQKHGCIK